MKQKGVRVLLASAMAMSLMFGSVVTAQAATDVNIEAKATEVNVTVPTTAAMIFNADGSDTVPTNFSITNNSELGGVHVTTIDLDAKTSGWSLLPATADLATQAKNVKKIKLNLGAKPVVPATETTKGVATFGATDFVIPSKGSKVLSFGVDRGAFTTAQASAKAFDMTVNFDFN